MQIQFEHDCAGGVDTPTLFNVAIIFGGAAVQPVNIVIVLDCSQSMNGYPLTLAQEVIGRISAKYAATVIHAGRVPRVNPDDIRLTYYCNTVDAFSAARAFCLRGRRNHVVFVTDGFTRADYSDFSRDGVPFHIFNVGLGTVAAPFIWNAYDQITAGKCIDEFDMYIENTIYTGVSAAITAGDGVRITSMRAKMAEIVPMKSYRVDIGAITGEHVVYLRVSVREGHAAPILTVRATSGGIFVGKGALLDLSAGPRVYLGIEIMREILVRLRAGVGGAAKCDTVVAETAIECLLARYQNTPELLAVAAMCRNEISYLSNDSGGLEADDKKGEDI